MLRWFRHVQHAVASTGRAMWVTMRCRSSTDDSNRRTFAGHFEHPGLTLSVSRRCRGFHRYDLTTCVACERCARDCPAGCIHVGQERVPGRKGCQITSFTIDYAKCTFCALCIESCPAGCILMGSCHDLSGYARDGSVVDFSRLPVELAWGSTTANPAAVVPPGVVARR